MAVSITPAQVRAAFKIAALLRQHRAAIEDALNDAKAAGAALGNDNSIPDAERAEWIAKRDAAVAALTALANL